MCDPSVPKNFTTLSIVDEPVVTGSRSICDHASVMACAMPGETEPQARESESPMRLSYRSYLVATVAAKKFVLAHV